MYIQQLQQLNYSFLQFYLKQAILKQFHFILLNYQQLTTLHSYFILIRANLVSVVNTVGNNRQIKKLFNILIRQSNQLINRIDDQVQMLQDHDNLLSTFGKDSQSSNCKQKQLSQAVRNKRAYLNYEMQTQSRFERIFNQRNTLFLGERKALPQRGNKKEQSKKLKTESDIQDLNNKIRRSISGIAEIIGKSKNQLSQKNTTYDVMGLTTTKQLLPNSIGIALPSKTKSSYKQTRGFESVSKFGERERSGSSRYAQREKENLSYVNNSSTIHAINYTNSNSKVVSHADRATALGSRSSFGGNNNQKYSHEMIIRNDADKQRRQGIKSGEYVMRKDRSLRNSTKKKTNCCEGDSGYCEFSNSSNYNQLSNTNASNRNFINDNQSKMIKESYSIDLNSQRHHDSIAHHQQQQQSSRLHRNELHPAKFSTNVINSIKQQSYQPRLSTKHYRQSVGGRFNKKQQVSMRRDNEDTLKKELKQYDMFESNRVEQSKILQRNRIKGNEQKPKISTEKQCAKLVIHSNAHNNQFLFSCDDPNNSNSFSNNYFDEGRSEQQDKEQKSPDFNKIQVPRKFSLNDIKKRLIVCEDKKHQHPLIASLMDQIELDFDLRHAKHMFSGIEQPFSNQRYDSKLFLSHESSKWQLLNQELNNRGLSYNVETIKRIFLPSQQQLDPFLSVTHPHDQLIYSLIYAYETAEIHWQQAVYRKWQHWDLRDIELTIENIDRERKGYITVEDIAAFVSMQAGKEYKNRDVILIYKRLINGFSVKGQSNNFQSNTVNHTEGKLKFRSLIDSLIKNF